MTPSNGDTYALVELYITDVATSQIRNTIMLVVLTTSLLAAPDEHSKLKNPFRCCCNRGCRHRTLTSPDSRQWISAESKSQHAVVDTQHDYTNSFLQAFCWRQYSNYHAATMNAFIA
jgi:hypothetical protein